MQKQKVIIGGLVLGMALLLIGGYFAFTRYGQGSKRVVVENDGVVSVEQQEKKPEIVEQQLAVDDKAGEAASNLEEKAIIQPSPAAVDPENKNKDKQQVAAPKDSSTDKMPDGLVIKDKFISWGFEKRASRKIDTIIIHSSYDALGSDPYSIEGILAEYKQYGVSAHYLIGRDGVVYHLVHDADVAYHAGESKMPDGRTGVNAFSLGIEMVNTQDGKYTSVQYAALNALIAKLKQEQTIKYVLGHKEIAPGRKTDPWGIEWDKVAK